MANSTRMKNFESQLQQVNMTVTDLQLRVNSLEVGSSKNHEAILEMDQNIERIDRKVESIEATWKAYRENSMDS